jgi:biotin carboxyl carrier protein
MIEGAQDIWVTVNGERFLVQVENLHQRPVIAYVEGSRFEVDLEEATTTARKDVSERDPGMSTPQSISASTSCEVTAPMPGDIIQIHVKVGQVVKTGDPLCVLDAMKMKNTIHAPQDGEITEVLISEGQSVEYGVPLLRLG